MSFKVTEYWRLILPQRVGLILGFSSLSMNAIIVHTGISDEDLTGETAVTNTVPTNWSFNQKKNCSYY